MADRSKFAVSAPCIWAAVTCTIVLATWCSLHLPSDGLGWLLGIRVASGAIALVIILIAALVVGVATRSTLANLAGWFSGLILALCVMSVFDSVRARPAQVELGQKRTELAALIAAVERRDRDAVSQSLTTPHFTLPESVCLLTTMSSAIGLLDERHSRLQYPLTTADTLFVADVVASGTAPLAAKEAALYTVLTMLVHREPVGVFPGWIALWRRAHGQSASAYLAFEHPSDPWACYGGTDALLAETPIYHWRDAAVRAWLDQGLKFLPAQQVAALSWIHRGPTLAALVEAGVDSGIRDASGERAVTRMAFGISADLDLADTRAEAVDAAKELIRRGTGARAGDADSGDSACHRFSQGESQSNVARMRIEVVPEEAQERAAAAERIRSMFCGPPR